MGEGGEEEEEMGLESTPAWAVALVCALILTVSLIVQRCIHDGAKFLKRKKQKALREGLKILKEELMLLGFISLMLNVLQGPISKICIPKSFATYMLPCSTKESSSPSASKHLGRLRRMLSAMAVSRKYYCDSKDKVPFLSVEAFHHLHIFIFILAVVHVTFSVLTIVFGGARIQRWKQWEHDVANKNNDIDQGEDTEQRLRPEVTYVQHHVGRLDGCSRIIGWAKSFFKQFYEAVTKDDYLAFRSFFIKNRRPLNPNFNFHKYMISVLEDDFKRVVSIRWYLWVFVIIFLLLNVNGWNMYFWLAFIPLILVLAVGTKLEHVVSHLAEEIDDKPLDKHFWFKRPQIIIFLIHFILFQNAFEIAFLFWIWALFGINSCIVKDKGYGYAISRLIIGVIIQILCSYSTLPLYATVTQMGSTFKEAIFYQHNHVNDSTQHESTTSTTTTDGYVSVPLGRVAHNQSEGNEALSPSNLYQRQVSR